MSVSIYFDSSGDAVDVPLTRASCQYVFGLQMYSHLMRLQILERESNLLLKCTTAK